MSQENTMTAEETQPLVTLAYDEEANEWVDKHVPMMVAEELRAWARAQFERLDANDRAQIGVMLSHLGNLRADEGKPVIRGHLYAIVFTWADGEQKLVRSILRVDDKDQVAEFVVIDHACEVH